MDVTVASRDRHNLSLPATCRLILSKLLIPHFKNNQKIMRRITASRLYPVYIRISVARYQKATATPGPAILQNLFTPQDQIIETVNLTYTH